MGYLIENVLQKNSSLKILKKRDVDEKLLSKEKINIKKRKKKNKIHMIKWKHIKKYMVELNLNENHINQ